MDQPLSMARQRAVIAIAAQKQQVIDQANQIVQELDQALADLAATYAAGQEGEWAFARSDVGAVVLRRKEDEDAVPGTGQGDTAEEERAVGDHQSTSHG